MVLSYHSYPLSTNIKILLIFVVFSTLLLILWYHLLLNFQYTGTSNSVHMVYFIVFAICNKMKIEHYLVVLASPPTNKINNLQNEIELRGRCSHVSYVIMKLVTFLFTKDSFFATGGVQLI